MKDILTPQERERFNAVSACIQGTITNYELSTRLSLSLRQSQRLKRRVEEYGEEGIPHGGRGKRSNRAFDTIVTEIVTAFMHEKKHTDFGPTFAQEQLVKEMRLAGVEDFGRA